MWKNCVTNSLLLLVLFFPLFRSFVDLFCVYNHLFVTPEFVFYCNIHCYCCLFCCSSLCVWVRVLFYERIYEFELTTTGKISHRCINIWSIWKLRWKPHSYFQCSFVTDHDIVAHTNRNIVVDFYHPLSLPLCFLSTLIHIVIEKLQFAKQ